MRTCDGETLSSRYAWSHPVHVCHNVASLPLLILIVLGPGLLGHTGINYVLSRVSPLAVSLSLTLEPVTGVLVGMAFGFPTNAQTYTLAGEWSNM